MELRIILTLILSSLLIWNDAKPLHITYGADVNLSDRLYNDDVKTVKIIETAISGPGEVIVKDDNSGDKTLTVEDDIKSEADEDKHETDEAKKLDAEKGEKRDEFEKGITENDDVPSLNPAEATKPDRYRLINNEDAIERPTRKDGMNEISKNKADNSTNDVDEVDIKIVDENSNTKKKHQSKSNVALNKRHGGWWGGCDCCYPHHGHEHALRHENNDQHARHEHEIGHEENDKHVKCHQECEPCYEGNHGHEQGEHAHNGCCEEGHQHHHDEYDHGQHHGHHHNEHGGNCCHDNCCHNNCCY